MRIATCRLQSKASNTIRTRKSLMSLRLAVRRSGVGGKREAFLLVRYRTRQVLFTTDEVEAIRQFANQLGTN